MRLPPKWSRRLLIDPAFVVGVVLATATLPIIVIGATFVSRYVPGNWRTFRIVWFLFLYLVVEVVALILMFGLRIVSGFGWKLRSPVFFDTHYWLFGWMLRRVVASALFTFKVTIRREGGAPQTQDTRSRPILVMSRHAGPWRFDAAHGRTCQCEPPSAEDRHERISPVGPCDRCNAQSSSCLVHTCWAVSRRSCL